MIPLRHRFRWFFRKHRKNRSQIEKDYADIDTTLFWCRDARELPEAEVLQRAVEEHPRSVLCFSKWMSAPEKTGCIARVEAALPTCRVGTRKPEWGFDFVWFERVLPREEILAHAPELIASAREFGAIAGELARELAAQLGLSPAQLAAHGQYQEREPRLEQRGNLNNEWRYCFHGFQCGFIHRHTGQDVDVEFGFGEEFGALDPMFWHRFLQTTPRYQRLARWMMLGYTDAKQMFDVMVEAGHLVAIEGEISHGEARVSWERHCFIPARHD